MGQDISLLQPVGSSQQRNIIHLLLLQEAISRAHGVPLVQDWAPASDNCQQVSAQLLRHAKRRPRTRPLQVALASCLLSATLVAMQMRCRC